MAKIRKDLYLDLKEKELLKTLKSFKSYSKLKREDIELRLIARAIYTLHKKYNWSFKEIGDKVATTRRAGVYARLMKNVLGISKTTEVEKDREEGDRLVEAIKLSRKVSAVEMMKKIRVNKMHNDILSIRLHLTRELGFDGDGDENLASGLIERGWTKLED